ARRPLDRAAGPPSHGAHSGRPEQHRHPGRGDGTGPRRWVNVRRAGPSAVRRPVNGRKAGPPAVRPPVRVRTPRDVRGARAPRDAATRGPGKPESPSVRTLGGARNEPPARVRPPAAAGRWENRSGTHAPTARAADRPGGRPGTGPDREGGRRHDRVGDPERRSTTAAP